jgi:maleate cis-trans isomerase
MSVIGATADVICSERVFRLLTWNDIGRYRPARRSQIAFADQFSLGEMAMFQPDGWGQTRIGLLTPHADVVPEAEFSALAPDGISIHATRIPFSGYKPGGTMDPTIAEDPVRAIADPPAVDDAAEMLAMAPLHAIVFGFTSSSYVRGAADDAALKSRLETRTRGIPVVITCAAAASALAALSAKRVALISPPWFSAEMAQLGARYFQSQGFEAVYTGRFTIGSASYSAGPALQLGMFSRAQECRSNFYWW